MTGPSGRRGTPLSVHLAGLRVVVVGAGRVAADKLRHPLGAGAEVHVVAPEAGRAVREAAAEGRLTWHARAFAPGDVDGAVLVVAATADPLVNDAVAAAAAERTTLCVRVDGGGTADFAAAVRRGPLTLSVATGGAAPALARQIRTELAEHYDEAYGELTQLLGALRTDPTVRAALAELPAEERARRWRALPTPDILALIRAGHAARAREVAHSCLLSSSA